MLRVLVADDDSGLRISVAAAIRDTGRFEVVEAFDGQDAIEKSRAGQFNLAVLDVDMPRLNGMEALRLIKEQDPRTIVLILTAYANIDDAVAAVKNGAYNYISKPVKSDELLAMMNKALAANAMIQEVAGSSPVLVEQGRKFIGSSAEMRKVFNIIQRLANVETAVMIRGESGTGKELVARAIHFNSARKDQKFVAINCSAIPENLLESELFGHEKGAFTGADSRKLGKFQFAEGGTIFLDEIGDMPLLMQAKLLRVLQDKKFTPVGANRELEANVRIIAATNRNLEEMIKKNQFREDLFYRLNVVPIFLPSLRERKNDLDHLINSFIQKFNAQHSKRIIGVSPEALSMLKRYNWPGNIRELENVIEHSFVLEPTNRITIGSLPDRFMEELGLAEMQAVSSDGLLPPTPDSDEETLNGGERPAPILVQNDGIIAIDVTDLDFNKQKEMFEKEFIIKALKTFRGRINQTALHANIPKKTLLRKIEKYGINPREYNS